ncbi:L-asparaginase 2 [Dongshaea marina]|uniref:L-asparaginase 2 n=1 Tax=Dongshaea marina TaxID=2047966 RepID=UPI000D3E1EEE|nr:L-asparaginase 2 [Dongshaea marina]
MQRSCRGFRLWFSALFFLLFTASSFAATKPHIVILATGGTIAGSGASATQTNYTAGQLGVEKLIQAVPQIKQLARVSGEQISNIGSQDMNNKIWLKLADRVNKLLAQPDVDGVVITHGTDTMEETAYFLDLTVHSDKPVVLVGSMRPATAMSADGPMNLYDGVVTAVDKNSRGRGVLVVMNDKVLGARSVTKFNTTGVQAFVAPNFGPLGLIHDGEVDYQRAPERRHTKNSVFDVSGLKTLPKVGIIYNYENASPVAAKAFIDAGYQGIVSAGVGNGNMDHKMLKTLSKAAHDGVLVVRSSRVATGATTLNAEVNDSKYHFVASGTLNPQKARVLLMLALTKTHDYQKVQRYFQTY